VSLTGGSVPNYMTGRILMGKRRSRPAGHLILSADRSDNGIDMVRTVTDGKYVYSRNFMPFMPEVRYIRYMEIGEIKQQMRKELLENKLDPLQKSLFEDRPPEFLFDIENDLWETKNLVYDPEYKSVLNRMRSMLKKEMLQARDVLMLPEYEIGLISESTTPYEFRMDDDRYPVEDIYEAASLAGFRNEQIAARQIKLLKDPDRIKRYWSVIGLRSQTPGNLMPYYRDIANAMSDEYPPVAITAAAIIWQASGDQNAEEILKRYCASENMDLALMSINYLLYTDNKEPFIDTIRSVHDMEGRNYNVKAACMDFLGSLGLVPNNTDFAE
jgi:hypothetical protein